LALRELPRAAATVFNDSNQGPGVLPWPRAAAFLGAFLPSGAGDQ
jgi:hypothetical protein